MHSDLNALYNSIGSLDEFVQFINVYDSINGKKLNIPLSLKSYNYLWLTSDKRYKEISIPKKNGKIRKIKEPDFWK